MAGLEATLRITAQDDASATLAKIAAAFAKQIEAFDKIGSVASSAAAKMDPLVAAITATDRALADQRSEIGALARGLEKLESGASGAASAQARLRGEITRTNSALVSQAERSARAKGAGGAGRHGEAGALGALLPFEGPEILEKTKQAVEAGATVQEEIAKLIAAGAKPDQVAQARSDFAEFSKTHSGVLESDYLEGYKDARVIAPSEAYEMARLGATYRVAARNSGVSTNEEDVSNVLKVMDELGLKSTEQRYKLLDSMLKAQQAFGGQIKTDTYLAAVRNAKQSIYGWTDEFRDELFPTLLQSEGQQGGTMMMTALNNYIGHHMQESELRALAGAGFVDKKDYYFNKQGEMKLKDGAQMFEADVFKSNIVQWTEDFHKNFMSRHGATESGFGDLIDKMPRNMAGLLAFIVHNDANLRRDQQSMKLPVGMRAADDSYLAANPVAGLGALRDSIGQFAATVTSPAMTAVGASLQATASGLQKLAAAYSEFAAKNPEAAKSFGLGAMGAGAATGGYLSWKLITGLGRLFGIGGASEAGAGAAAGGIGAAGALGAGGAVVAAATGAALLIDQLGPRGVMGPWYSPKTTELDSSDLERSRRARQVWHNGSWVDDPEAARGRALGALTPSDLKVSLDPASKADVSVNVTVNASSELLKAVADAKAASAGNIAAHVGRMDGDAGPNRAGSSGGIGHR